MQALKGYYDGRYFKAIDKVNIKKNQKVIITVLEEFIDEGNNQDKAYKKYIGKLSDENYSEIVEAIKDCEKVDENEW